MSDTNGNWGIFRDDDPWPGGEPDDGPPEPRPDGLPDEAVLTRTPLYTYCPTCRTEMPGFLTTTLDPRYDGWECLGCWGVVWVRR